MKLTLVVACSSKMPPLCEYFKPAWFVRHPRETGTRIHQRPRVLNKGVDAQHNFCLSCDCHGGRKWSCSSQLSFKNTQDFFVAALFYGSTNEKELKFLSFLKLALHFFRKNTDLANSRWRDIWYVLVLSRQTLASFWHPWRWTLL